MQNKPIVWCRPSFLHAARNPKGPTGRLHVLQFPNSPVSSLQFYVLIPIPILDLALLLGVGVCGMRPNIITSSAWQLQLGILLICHIIHCQKDIRKAYLTDFKYPREVLAHSLRKEMKLDQIL